MNESGFQDRNPHDNRQNNDPRRMRRHRHRNSGPRRDGDGPHGQGGGSGPGPREGFGPGPGPREGFGPGPGPREGFGPGPGPREGFGSGPGPVSLIEAAQIEVDLRVPEDGRVVIGLTGEPGSGKSALARAFARLGAECIDVDQAGHAVIELPEVKRALIEAYGEDMLSEDGSVQRPRLAAKAFRDPKSTQLLNRIVHPPLVERVRGLLAEAGNFAVIDAALLFELGLNAHCTQTVYVRAPRDLRLERVTARGWNQRDLERRERALGNPDARRRACGLTVDNSGDPELLTTYARTILARQLGIDLLANRRQGADRVSSRVLDEEDAAPPQPSPSPNLGPSPGPSPVPAPVPSREAMHVDLNEYLRKDLPALQEEGDRLDVREVRWLRKHDLVCEILRRVASGRADDILVEGFVEPFKDQHGYLRSRLNAYLPCGTDAFISGQQMRRFGLQAGMHVIGVARAPRGSERTPQLLAIKEVMGEPIDRMSRTHAFISLTPLHPTERLFMERRDKPEDLSLRIVDLVAPIGKGQRGLIVSQPKCGKTTYLQKIANSISANNPEVILMVLLVDERPEEVTDMERGVKAEVIASTFDQPAARHIQIAEMTINKARRLVEHGKDVVILLDSITRLARAYNTEAPSSGRIMSGGIEAGALIKPRQFLASARNIEHGGSLTILATALVDTGSLMDNVIFEEFKATGNMELVLDRRLSNKRIFPAVDVAQSGTRKEDLMIRDPEEVRRLWALRRFLAERTPQDAIEFLKGKLAQYPSNIEFLMKLDPDRMNQW